MKKVIIFLIFISFSILSESSYGFDSDLKKNEINKEKIIESKVDTIVIIEKQVDKEILKNYTQILEKTNNQLSLWFNPYGIFISMLGVLFTFFAVIVAFIIFRQSKEYKDLIRKSIDEHKLTLENLVREKENQMRNIELSIDKTIIDYKMQLTTAGEEHKSQIENFIEKLEDQKDFLGAQLLTYNHSGWNHKDIQINNPINRYSKFYTRIVLNQPNQLFTIYLKIKTKNNKLVWLGFAGNSSENLPLKNQSEYKVDIGTNPNTNRVVMNENIYDYFIEGFDYLKTEPVEVVCVRLRASDEDKKEITFSFRIS